VVLYRDGVLVEPYGLDGDDWIGVSARKAQRQGHAAIQPNTFTGYVTIGRFSNPELRDMSNRSGLLDNEASEEFQEHIRAEFRVFESIVYEEVFEKFRWEDSRANKAGQRSLASAERAVVFMRSLAHSIRQPLFGLQMELSALGSLAKRPDLSEEIKEILRVAEQKSKQYLNRADEVIRQVMEFQPPEFAEIQASDLIDRALNQVADLAKSKGTEIRVGKMVKNKKVLVPEALVVNALGALLFNALEAPHAEGVAEVVELDDSAVNKDVCITIRDNGLGIESYDPSQGLGSIKSSKGRPAMGLSMAEMSIISAQGRLRLVSTGREGTEFEVALPSRVSGVHS
jgi:signal transduction histidine kinase